MPDPTMSEAGIAAGAGAIGGLMGGAVVTLSENMSRKQVLATVISALGFGSFVPPGVMTIWQFHPALAGLIGFVCGLTCIFLVAGIQNIGKAFKKKPGAFIPQIKDAFEEANKVDRGTGP